ncbi:hypothetical protein PI95_031655, partial [Hassallia byssoidea VB512170]|nr:hypothetical protein [Hassalia byssoidea VB512170]
AVLGFPQVEHLAWQGSQCGLGVSPSGASGVAGGRGASAVLGFPQVEHLAWQGAGSRRTNRNFSLIPPLPTPHSPLPHSPLPTPHSSHRRPYPLPESKA